MSQVRFLPSEAGGAVGLFVCSAAAGLGGDCTHLPPLASCPHPAGGCCGELRGQGFKQQHGEGGGFYCCYHYFKQQMRPEKCSASSARKEKHTRWLGTTTPGALRAARHGTAPGSAEPGRDGAELGRDGLRSAPPPCR